jgi:hypothetical protein
VTAWLKRWLRAHDEANRYRLAYAAERQHRLAAETRVSELSKELAVMSRELREARRDCENLGVIIGWTQRERRAGMN